MSLPKLADSTTEGPTGRPSIDVSQVPLHEAAALLRRIGRRTLEDLLGERPLSGGREVTDLTAQIIVNLPAASARVRNRFTDVFQSAVSRFGVGARASARATDLEWLTVLQAEIRDLHVDSPRPSDGTVRTELRFERAATRKLRAVLGLDAQARIPQHWHDLLSTLTWDEADLQLVAGEWLIAYARSHYLMTFDEVSAGIKLPRISANTWWALVMLAAAQRGRVNEQRNALQNLALDWIQSLASGFVAKPGWAGFWDQWLLLRAFTLGLFTPSTDAMAAWVAGLPLKSWNLEQPGDSKSIPLQTFPEWANDVPTWYERSVDHQQQTQ